MSNSSRVLWIVLGSIGGVLLLMCAVCGGGALWFSSYPSVSPSASQPFDLKSAVKPNQPPQVSEEQLVEGARFREVVWGDGSGNGNPPGANGRLWIYLPEAEATPGSLPCVFIAGAGSTLLEGMQLSEGDQPEHFPYVAAGFAVVAYDLDGGSDGSFDIEPEDPSEEVNTNDMSYDAFRSSMAGLINARNAIDFTLSNVPEVNPKKLFAAGHSSAGTLALLLAEHEPRIAGCVAYAPAIDLKKRFPAAVVRMMSSMLPNMAEFIVQSSPRTHEDHLNCPTLIFHAADDSNVPIADSRDFVKRMQAKNKDVTLLEVPSGDHYESMINEGIPKGIEFINKQIGK